MRFRSLTHFVFLICLWLSAFYPCLSQSTAADSTPVGRRYTLKSFIVPSVLAGSGVALLNERTRAPFRSEVPITNIDDFLVAGPYALRLGLGLSGVRPALAPGDEFLVTALSNIGTAGVTLFLKHGVRSRRPDGSDTESFSSGHTALAFNAAELLHQAYRHKSPWISIAGYSMASAVGVLRLANNRHHWADVLAGAAIGMASVKITYIAYPYVKRVMTPRRSRSRRSAE